MPITNLSTVTFTAAETKKINDALADIKLVIAGKTTTLQMKKNNCMAL